MRTYTFKFGTGLRILLWGFAIMFAAFAAGASALPWFEPNTPFALAAVLASLFTGFMLLCAWCAYRLSALISVDEEAITRTSMRGRETRIAWNDIGAVDEGSSGQMLIVRDKLRTREIAIESQIVGFNALREVISARARALTEFSIDQLPVTFPRIRFIYILILILAVAAAAMGSMISFGQPAVPVFLFVLAVLIGVLVIWHSLEADPDGLIYRYYFGRVKRIPIESIEDSRLTSLSATGNYGEPHRIAQLAVLLKNGKSITISGIRGGTMTLHAALQAALEAQGRKDTSRSHVQHTRTNDGA